MAMIPGYFVIVLQGCCISFVREATWGIFTVSDEDESE